MIIHKLHDNYYCQFSKEEMEELRHGLGCTWSEDTCYDVNVARVLRDAFDEMLD